VVDYENAYKTLSKNDFLELTMPLANYVLGRYIGDLENVAFSFGGEVEDVRQEAYCELVRIYDRFNPERGIKWSAFATKCIVNRVLQRVRFNKQRKKFHDSMVFMDGRLYMDDNDHHNVEISKLLGIKEKGFKEIEDKDCADYIYSKLSPILSEKEKEIYDIIRRTNAPKIDQRKIAKMIGMSQPDVSRKLKSITEKGKRIALLA
jgi:RNA polymerase sigma factor (sigma-70 family)